MANKLKRWNGTTWITIIDGDGFLPIGGGTATGPITAPSFTSSVAIGTPPFTVTSTTKVTNLNVDRLDDLDSTQFVRSDAASTISSLGDAGVPNLTLANSGVSANEGGELKLQGQAGKPSWHLDAYNLTMRIIQDTTQRLTIDSTGRVTIPPTTSGQTTNLKIDPNAGTSNRASIGFDTWELGQDSAQGGGLDFFLYGASASQVFSISSNGDTYWNKSIIWPNSVTLWAKDSGGTNKIWIYPRFSDNCLYLDGGTGGMSLRTNDGAVTNLGLTTDGNVTTGNSLNIANLLMLGGQIGGASNTAEGFYAGTWGDATFSSAHAGQGVCINVNHFGAANINDQNFMSFRQAGTQIGFIDQISAPGTGVTYSSGSDARLKERIDREFDALAIIENLRPTWFRWKSSGGEEYGLFAQELYEHWPTPVSQGDEDLTVDGAKPWGIDYGRLTPLLLTAIQQLVKRVEALEGVA